MVSSASCGARKIRKVRAVFLDRDGTLNPDPGYMKDARDFKFLPRVKFALKLLAKNRFKLFVVTNQSGIGRGWITHRDVEKIHRKMVRELKVSGVSLQGVYVCPHSPTDDCDCRKPSPKLILRAVRKYKIDCARSFLVGDKLTDIQAGLRAGLGTVLLLGDKTMEFKEIQPDYVAQDMAAAAKWIIKKKERPKP